MSSDTYLGETPVALADSPFSHFTPRDFAMYFIEKYGGIDGAHHKTWVLDQVARALHNCPIVDLRVAKWSDAEDEYRFSQGESAEYLAWVDEMKGDGEYDYDEGVAP